MQRKANKRDIRFDIFRGIGITFMIMGHIGFGDYFSHYIHAFHMPIFFFVSGYFSDRKKHDSFRKCFLHDIRTLIIPYTIFFLVCQVLHYVYVREFSIQYSVLSYFSSNHNRIDVEGSLWFLLCLFTVKQLFWLIERIKPDKIKVLVAILLALIGHLFNNQIDIVLPLCLDSAMVSMPIMLMGYLYKKYEKSKYIKKINSIEIWKVFLGLLLNGILIMINAPVNLRANHHGCIPLYWLNCIIAVSLWMLISQYMAYSEREFIKKPACLFSYIGKNSMVFLVLNELFIFAITSVVNIIGVSKHINYFLNQTIVFILTMAGLSAACVLFKIKNLRIAIGR